MSQNGEPELIGQQQQNPVLKLLERVMVDAKAGKFAGIAFVAVSTNGQLINGCAGPSLSDLFVATSILQDTLKVQIANPQPRGGLVKATGPIPPMPGLK